MEYDTFNIKDIPVDEVDELSARCSEIFRNNMLAGSSLLLSLVFSFADDLPLHP
jgi:hypothetical protein